MSNKHDAKKVNTESNVMTQAAFLMGAGIITRIIGILYRSPVTSIIGDVGNGYYSFAVNIYTMILLICSYSIPMAVSKVVSGKLALRQYRDAHKVFYCALFYVAGVGGVASVATYFLAPFLISGSQAAAVPVLRVLTPTIFLSGFLGVLRGYFQAHSTMAPTSVSQIVEQLVNAAVSIGAAILFIRLFSGGDPDKVPVFGAMGSAAGIGAGVAAGLLFMLFVYMLNRRTIMKRIARDRSGADSTYREIFKVILLMVTPVILSTFIYNISTVLDQTLFVRVLDTKGVAAITAATVYGVFSTKYYTLINVPIALANSMSTAMLPAVSSAYTVGDREGCNAQVSESIHFAMIICVPAAVGIGVMARPIMELLFPQRATIDLAVNMLHLGCLGVVFYSLSTITNGVLQGIGKVNIPLRNALIALPLHVAVLIPLLLYTDLNGYAMVYATMAYAFMMCLFNNLSVRRYLGYRQEFKRTFLIPAICSLIMGAFCYIVYYSLYSAGMLLSVVLPVRIIIFICLMIAVLLSMGLYFVLVLFMRGITETELYHFPKGGALVRLAKKMKLL